jgi:hypothetical protein
LQHKRFSGGGPASFSEFLGAFFSRRCTIPWIEIGK